MGRVGIAFGSFDDAFKFEALRTYVAEFISTLLLVFAGVGSVMAYGSLICFLQGIKIIGPRSANNQNSWLLWDTWQTHGDGI